MFAFKNNYFLIIESIKDFDLRNIKIYNKFNIIYRNNNKSEEIESVKSFRKNCKLKKVKFYVANNIKLAVSTRADGLYISAFNKDLKYLNLKKNNFTIIGSAHNIHEVRIKIQQGCNYILLSKLFKVDYDQNAPYLGLIKFNNYCRKISKKLVALGGINNSTLNYLKNVNCKSVAILSGVKKSRLK